LRIADFGLKDKQRGDAFNFFQSAIRNHQSAIQNNRCHIKS
jgi:hypothetical protein